MVWVWTLKISPKNVKFFNFLPLGSEKIASGRVRKYSGWPLIYCRSKLISGRVRSGPISITNPAIADHSKSWVWLKAYSNWIGNLLDQVKIPWDEQNLSDESIRRCLRRNLILRIVIGCSHLHIFIFSITSFWSQLYDQHILTFFVNPVICLGFGASRVESSQFLAARVGSGRVSHLCFGFEFGKLLLKTSNFSIFFLSSQK